MGLINCDDNDKRGNNEADVGTEAEDESMGDKGEKDEDKDNDGSIMRFEATSLITVRCAAVTGGTLTLTPEAATRFDEVSADEWTNWSRA